MQKRIDHLVLSLVILASFLYMNLDGLPLTHPGNIKAADPFYHTLAVENILDTHQWKYYPSWIGLGETKAMNVQPPLLYTQAAILTTFTSLPSWTTLYFLVCLFVALGIGIAFFIFERSFKSTPLSLLAVMALVIPFHPEVWLYQIFIGLWIQAVSFLFVIAFVWMFLVFIQDAHRWSLWIANACIVAILIIHPQDLIPLFPLWAVLAWTILSSQTTWKQRATDLVALASFSGVLFIILLPHFIWVWGGASHTLTPGWFGYQSAYYEKIVGGGPVLPVLTFFPWYIIVLAGVGFFALIAQARKYRSHIIFIAAYFCAMYLTPFVIKDAYYLLRMRALQPYFIIPLICLLVISLLGWFRLERRIQLIAAAVLGVVIIAMSYGTYSSLQQSLAGEHITEQKWRAYQWVQDTLSADDTMLMIEGGQQANPMFTKRMVGIVEMPFLFENAQRIANGTMPSTWFVEWNGMTVRHSNMRETGFIQYEKYPERERNTTLIDYDYVYLENQNEDIARLNQIILDNLTPQGYRVAYNQDGILIAGRE